MKVLSLDLSSKSTGYALFEDTTYLTSGCITASSKDVVARIIKITDEIEKIIETNKPIDIVVMEEVLPAIGHNSNKNVWKALTWSQASIVFLLHRKYPLIQRKFIMPNTWRSKIGIKTGVGIKRAALKQADIDFVKEHYNLDVNDDEADSISLGHAYIHNINNEINWA